MFSLLAKMRRGGPMRDKRTKRAEENKNPDYLDDDISHSPSLLDRAKVIAEQEESAAKKKAEEELAILGNYQKQLLAMRSLLLKEVQKLDQQPSKYGTFKVTESNGVIFLCSDYKRIAWFKAKVVTGTYDASDDCRGIPYTEARVWARLYSPNYHRDHDGNWDLEEQRWYHNGGWTERVSSVEEMPKFLEEVAKHLAQWI